MKKNAIGTLAQLEMMGKKAAVDAARAQSEADEAPWGRTRGEVLQEKARRRATAKAHALFVALLRTAYVAIRNGVDPVKALQGFEAPEGSLLGGALRRAREIAAGKAEVHPRVLDAGHGAVMKNEEARSILTLAGNIVEMQVGYGSDEKPAPEREEPTPTERSRRVYLKVRDLPAAIQRGLAAVSYARSDIEVEAAEKGSPFDAGSEGRRGFVVLVSVNPSYSGEGIGSGIYEIHRGSWGGANLFATSNPVDLDQAEHRIPPTGAVINGSTGYGGVRARVTMHPALLASLKLLPAPAEELTPEEAATMYAFGCLKGGAGRRDHMARHGAGEGTIDALVARGLLKRNAAGAVSITLAGKNTRRSSGAGEGW